MLKSLNKIRNNQQGSSLLVALLIMGVLMALALILSRLIFREIAINKDVIDSGKAYYAAESGVEIALYEISNNLPGWEPNTVFSDNNEEVGIGDQEADVARDFKTIPIDPEFEAVGEFRVKNRCNTYPCFDAEEYEFQGTSPKAFYDVLELNESITIPLFVIEEGPDGPIERRVKDFTVEFFGTFNPDQDLNFNPRELSGWNVLRWKIAGARTDNYATESISDFSAFTNVQVGGDQFATNAEFPSWFGTVSCSGPAASGRITDLIQCLEYAQSDPQIVTADNLAEFIAENPQYADELANVNLTGQASINFSLCSNTEAKEFNQYSYFGEEAEFVALNPCYKIKNFLEDHELNYLTLTNLINPSAFKVKNSEFNKIYYRVELFVTDDQDFRNPGGLAPVAETVREEAEITSHGYSGDVKQTLSVKLPRGGFVPVFNFSLYSTYQKEDN